MCLTFSNRMYNFTSTSSSSLLLKVGSVTSVKCLEITIVGVKCCSKYTLIFVELHEQLMCGFLAPCINVYMQKGHA